MGFLFSIACDSSSDSWTPTPTVPPTLGGPHSTYPGTVGLCAGGTPFSPARLDPQERGDGLLSDLTLQACGQSGQDWHVHNGSIRMTGNLTFSRVYSARANIHTPSSYHTPPGHFPSPQITSCPSIGVPYPISCQAQTYNGNFRGCSVSINGQNYQLSGSIIHSKQASPARYDIINVSICGLCGHSGVGFGCTQTPF